MELVCNHGYNGRGHFSHPFSSGWIPNGDGTWHKDSNAEFDSDEEEPESVQ